MARFVYLQPVARVWPVDSRRYKLISYKYPRDWVASLAALPLAACTPWVASFPISALVCSQQSSVLDCSIMLGTLWTGEKSSAPLCTWVGTEMWAGNWKVFPSWNSFPPFPKYTETVIRSHLNISLCRKWAFSCVDLKNVFDFWLTYGVQSTYYLIEFVVVMVQTPVCWQIFHLSLPTRSSTSTFLCLWCCQSWILFWLRVTFLSIWQDQVGLGWIQAELTVLILMTVRKRKYGIKFFLACRDLS